MERKATIYDFVRMCASNNDCSVCPFNDTEWMDCVESMLDNQKKSNDIILKWCDEHPEKKKTYKQDFLEKFPNATPDEYGYPPVCRFRLYGGESQCFGVASCKDCWNEEMSE